jgi:hypothetical protein
MPASPSPDQPPFRGSTAHDWAVIMRRRREVRRTRSRHAALRALINAPGRPVSEDREGQPATALTITPVGGLSQQSPMGRCLIPAPASRNTPPSGLRTESSPPPEVRKRDDYQTAEVSAPVAWTPIDDRMPPEGVVVEADFADGRRLRLKWQGRLWRFRDESHHLFYTPLYWRPLAGPAAGAPGPEPMAARSVGPGILAVLALMAGVGAAALAAHRFTAPASTVWQAGLAIVLAALPVALLYGGVFGWTRRRPV